MKSSWKFGALAFLAAVAISCNDATTVILKTNIDKTTATPAVCESSIKYGLAESIVEGVDLPTQIGVVTMPIELGSIFGDPKLLREATKLAEVFDKRRITNCLALQNFNKVDEKNRMLLFREITKDVTRIDQLARCMILPSDNLEKNEVCTRNWFKTYKKLGKAIQFAMKGKLKNYNELPKETNVVVPFESLLGK